MKPILKTIPAKPVKDKIFKDEDYSTPYQPPVAPTAPTAGLPAHLKAMGLSVSQDPLPDGRSVSLGSKYDAIFAPLQYGQCIVAPTEMIGRISNGLRKYLKTQKKPGIVRTALRYAPDGTGRVWLLKETQ